MDPKTASPYSWYMEIPTIINASSIIAGKKPADTLGVKAVDDRTFEVQLEKAVPYFVSMLSHHHLSGPEEGDRSSVTPWTQPGNMVSNGAYVLKDWVVNRARRRRAQPQLLEQRQDRHQQGDLPAHPVHQRRAEPLSGWRWI